MCGHVCVCVCLYVCGCVCHSTHVRGQYFYLDTGNGNQLTRLVQQAPFTCSAISSAFYLIFVIRRSTGDGI